MNEGNIRAVKAIASTNILMNWNKGDNHSTPEQISTGATSTKHGWVATATVNEHGDISDLKIYVADDAPTSAEQANGIANNECPDPTTDIDLTKSEGVVGTLEEEGLLETIGFVDGVYYVQVYMKDIDYTAEEFTA